MAVKLSECAKSLNIIFQGLQYASYVYQIYYLRMVCCLHSFCTNKRNLELLPPLRVLASSNAKVREYKPKLEHQFAVEPQETEKWVGRQ